jgi:hypothetical protein
MCKLFKVSRSCYYNWIEKGSIVNKIDKDLNNLIKIIFEQARALKEQTDYAGYDPASEFAG